jgi:putative membrane protein
MFDDALAAYGHFLAIFTTLSLLMAEAALYRRAMSRRTLDLLRRLDLGYLFAAIAIIATGVLRLFASGKGAAFYLQNPVFWVKMGLFLAVGLLSVPPTIHYIRTATATPRESPPTISAGTYRRIRLFLVLQLAGFALIPLAATLMARGVGL